MLIRIRRAPGVAGFVAAVVLVLTMTGSAAAASGELGSGVLASAVPGLSAFASPALLVRDHESAFGSFSGESPQALTVDQASGDVYVVDPSGKKLWRYSAGGAPVDFTAGADAGSNALTGMSYQPFPSYDEVAVDASSGPAKGDVYVTNSAAGVVKVFAASGELLATLTGSGTPSGSLGEACGVAVDQTNGDLYVASRGSRIWRYSPSGAAVSEADYSGGIETSIEPCQIAVANGDVYAKAWQEFPVEGAGPVDSYATSAFATGAPPAASGTQLVTRATAIATDPASGDLYADERSKVTVYSPAGTPLYSYGSGEIGNFSAGVAVAATGDSYVADTTNHRVRIYGPFSAPAPLLEAKPATGVGHVKATMNAHLDPNGGLPITGCTFEWGTDTNYTEAPVGCEQGSAYTAPASVSAKLAGLAPGTAYHYRLHVTTSTSSYTSEDETFTTTPQSSTPEVQTGEATIVSSSSTQMTGTIDPNANPLTGCHFEYVTDLAYQDTGFGDLSSGGSVPCDQAPGSIAADFEEHEVTATATGLDPGQIYRYRLVAENANGSGHGEAALLAGPPIAETTGSPARTATTARLDSRVTTHGAPTDYWFEYTTDAEFKANGYANATATARMPLLIGEVQRIYLNWGFGPYTGQFRLTLDSETTRDIPYNATPAELESALGALPSVGGAANVHVNETADSREGLAEFYYITFAGNLAGVNLPQLVYSPGTSPVTGLNSSPVLETMIQGGRGDVASIVSADVEGLQPDTTYHFRVVADNGTPGGPSYGGDQTLTTWASDAPLTHGDLPGPRGSDRAWEQVSTPDTDGNASFVKSVSDSGERVLYGVDGGTPESINGGSAFGESDIQLAERSASGWHDRSLFPARALAPGNIWRGIWGSTELNVLYGLNYDQIGTGPADVWALRLGGSDQKLYSTMLETYNPTGNWMAASDDGSRMVIALNGTNDPAYTLPEGEEELYDLSGGGPRLVGLLPGNTLPPCGVHMNTGGQLVSPTRHWLTPDGSHLFFYAYPGSKCEGEPLGLYDRDLADSSTRLIALNATFIRSAGGSVFIFTGESLVAGDSGEPDVYRYQLDDGSLHCVTCALLGGTGSAGHADYSQGISSEYVVSNDGSHIYFIAARRLLPGAASRGIYRIDVSNGDLAYVAPVDPLTQFSEDSSTGTAISPNGSFLAFRSADPELNALNGQQNADSNQFYLYDDSTGSVVCASCPPDGTAPRAEAELSAGAGGSYYVGANGGALADDGDYVFSTPTALVPADQNTAPVGQRPTRGEDLYEWRDGRLLLVTDGKTEGKGAQVPAFDGMSPSGRDVFFNQAAALTPDAIDASNHLYDARIGGGFSFPSPPPPCSLEACQGVPLPPPDDATPASLSFSGPGNHASGSVAPKRSGASHRKKRRCARGRVIKRGRCAPPAHRKKRRCAKSRLPKHGKCVKAARRRGKRANHNKRGAK